GGGDSGQYTFAKRKSGLVGEAEQFADEVSLADRISFGHPSHSALPDHIHCLDTLQRPPSTLKRSIALGQPNSFLNRPVSCSITLLRYLHWRRATRRGMAPSTFSSSTAAG